MSQFDADRRRYPRLPLEVEVELYRPGQAPQVVRTEDLSNGGVFLDLEGADPPPLGARVQVKVVGMLGGGEAAPLVDALVVRHADGGFAVTFTQDEAD